MEQFSVKQEFIGNVPVIFIEGDMTSESEETIMSAFESAKLGKDISRLLIDFSETKYINSAGIGILINIIESFSAKGGRVSFCGLSNHFLKVMDIVGISDFVDIYDTIDDAIPR